MLIDGKEYEIEIIRKNNKNTYIRVKDGKIVVTTGYLTTERMIKKLITSNKVTIEKMARRVSLKEARNNDGKFYLFGKAYVIKMAPNVKKIYVCDDIIMVRDEKMLEKFRDNYIKNTFSNHLFDWYSKFREDIPRPSLRIRKLKTRWGVCNTRSHVITLNKELFGYDIDCLDYVCVHELAHLVYPNHSKYFWMVVEEYCPNYKEIRKKLRN